VWFPNWPIQRLRNTQPELKLRRSELVLFAGHNQRLWVTACSPRAERLGVRAGQPLAEARALCRKAVYLPADPAADREALCQLALEGQRFSPLVGLEEGSLPESLLSDVTGCTHLWNGEEPFLQAVRDHWTQRGFQIQLALAGTVGAAWAVAHASRCLSLRESRAAFAERKTTMTVVPAGGEAEALSCLPATLLRLPMAVLERLDALGLRTIGDVLQLPRETLASRFGLILPERLDQALGQRPESFAGERLCEPLAVVRTWEVPLENRLDVAAVCREMLRTLLCMAPHPGAGLQELEGELRTEADAVKLEIRLVEPSRDEHHLAQLVELHLERCTWSGGVIGIRWVVLRLGSLAQIQHDWFADEHERARDTSRQVVALVERLSSRLGDDRVLRVEIVPDPQPEHAVQLMPWMEAGSKDASELAFALPPEHARCRPFRLLGVPQPIAVVSVVPDGPPIRMTWRTQDHRVVRCWGPERIATGWWRAPDVQRDYYRAEWEDGTHVWIFRDGRGGRWFLHGFFE
jgi:protein ImuB